MALCSSSSTAKCPHKQKINLLQDTRKMDHSASTYCPVNPIHAMQVKNNFIVTDCFKITGM